MVVVFFNNVQMKAFIDTCDNQLVEQAFTDTKHIGHHEFCDAVTSLRRTAHKEVTHVEALTKVFSEDIGPAIDQLTKALYSYMQSECQCMWGSGYAKSHVETTSCMFPHWPTEMYSLPHEARV